MQQLPSLRLKAPEFSMHTANLRTRMAQSVCVYVCVCVCVCVCAVHVYQAVVEDGPAEDDSGEDGVPAFSEWLLPNAHFDGLWDTLYYDRCVDTLCTWLNICTLMGSQRHPTTTGA